MNRSTRRLALSALALSGLLAGAANAQRGPAGYHLRRPVVPRTTLRSQVRVLPAPVCFSPVWIPGRYELVAERVWIPGRERRVRIEPMFETRCDLWGRPRQVLVAPGHWQVTWEPGRYETRTKRVWRPGRYAPPR